MARNSSSDPIVLDVTLNSLVSSGIYELVAPETDVSLFPRSAFISSHGGGPFEFDLTIGSGGTPFLHGHVASNESEEITWPKGFELPKGSGIYLSALTNDGSIALYYNACDDSAGISKEQARSATYVASVAGPKAIRTPNIFGGQSQG